MALELFQNFGVYFRLNEAWEALEKCRSRAFGDEYRVWSFEHKLGDGRVSRRYVTCPQASLAMRLMADVDPEDWHVHEVPNPHKPCSWFLDLDLKRSQEYKVPTDEEMVVAHVQAMGQMANVLWGPGVETSFCWASASNDDKFSAHVCVHFYDQNGTKLVARNWATVGALVRRCFSRRLGEKPFFYDGKSVADSEIYRPGTMRMPGNTKMDQKRPLMIHSGHHRVLDVYESFEEASSVMIQSDDLGRELFLGQARVVDVSEADGAPAALMRKSFAEYAQNPSSLSSSANRGAPKGLKLDLAPPKPLGDSVPIAPHFSKRRVGKRWVYIYTTPVHPDESVFKNRHSLPPYKPYSTPLPPSFIEERGLTLYQRTHIWVQQLTHDTSTQIVSEKDSLDRFDADGNLYKPGYSYFHLRCNNTTDCQNICGQHGSNHIIFQVCPEKASIKQMCWNKSTCYIEKTRKNLKAPFEPSPELLFHMFFASTLRKTYVAAFVKTQTVTCSFSPSAESEFVYSSQFIDKPLGEFKVSPPFEPWQLQMMQLVNASEPGTNVSFLEQELRKEVSKIMMKT